MPGKRTVYHNVTVEVESDFDMEMVFCSCSLAIDKHDEGCPNYGKYLNFDAQPETILTLKLEDGTVHRIALDKYRFLEEPEDEARDSG